MTIIKQWHGAAKGADGFRAVVAAVMTLNGAGRYFLHRQSVPGIDDLPAWYTQAEAAEWLEKNWHLVECPECEWRGCVECDGPQHRSASETKPVLP